jgi:hypothetical protein
MTTTVLDGLRDGSAGWAPMRKCRYLRWSDRTGSFPGQPAQRRVSDQVGPHRRPVAAASAADYVVAVVGDRIGLV